MFYMLQILDINYILLLSETESPLCIVEIFLCLSLRQYTKKKYGGAAYEEDWVL